jgi:hypothetical protein
VSAVVLSASQAAAQSDDEKRARTLFEEARALVEAGSCARALPKLKESLSLRESIGAHLNLAQCLAPSDPTEAWRHDRRAEEMALDAHDDRASFAREQARTLEARVALVRVALPESARGLSGLSIKVDGAPLEAKNRDRGFALAPGAHTVEVSAPGKQTWKQQVNAVVGSEALAIPVLEDETPPPSPPPVTPETPRQPERARPEARPAPDRTMSYVLGGVALVGLGAGTYFGLRASSDWSQAKDTCGAGCAPNSPAYDERNSARTAGNVATVSFIVAGAALAGAIVLFVTSSGETPRKSAARAWSVGSF